MNCASVENILDLYAEDRLCAGRRALVAAHLAACPACGGQAAFLARLRAAPKPKMPAELKARLLRAAAQASAGREPAKWNPLSQVLTPALAGAALAAALLLVNRAGPGVPSQKKLDTPWTQGGAR